MQGSTTEPVDPVSHYERYVEAWNDHDVDAIMETFAEDITYFDPATGEPLEREGLVPFIEEVIEGFPDVRFEPRRILRTEEDGVITVEWTMYATHEGTYDGIPPTGERVELDGVDIVEITDDGIASVRGYFNESDFAEQLGLDFPAVVGTLPKLVAGKLKEEL